MRSAWALVFIAAMGCDSAREGPTGRGLAAMEAEDPADPVLTCVPASAPGAPVIAGVPTLSLPPLLDWPRDVAAPTPDLTEPTNNRLYDLHGEINDCASMDLVFSTAGNYHMALRDLFRDVLLPSSTIENWYYTTSPPIVVDQINNSVVGFGNFELGCRPMATAGPLAFINSIPAQYKDGAAAQIFRNRGNVILVKKGNPRHIHDIWDLRKPNVRVVTPHPCLEAATFTNYSGSIYNIAANDPNGPGGWTAAELFDRIFNNDNPNKWLIGARIHHREMPWAIAYGKADAGVIFYHLALDAVRSFPDLFEIVPLGGTAEDPQPLPGNQVGAHFAVRIAGSWTSEQLTNRELLMQSLVSPQFGAILQEHGLLPPL